MSAPSAPIPYGPAEPPLPERLLDQVLGRMLRSSALLGSIRDLLFPPLLERHYCVDLRANRIRELRLTLLLGVGLDLFTTITDFAFVPDLGPRALGFRLVSLLPIALLYALLPRVRCATRETLLTLGCASVVSGLLAVAIASRWPYAPFAYFTASLGLIFANCVLAVRFRDGIGLNVTFVLALALLTWFGHQMSPAISFALTMQSLIAAGFSLVTSYKIERSARINYLLSSKETARRLEMAADRDRFQRLAATDTLTGLPNRNYFRQHFEEVRRSGSAGARSRCLLMLDVDHFKSYNDSFGHLEGDRCLHLIASVLSTRIQGPLDLAARYGGEEFILLLCDVTESLALAFAERLRCAVERVPVTVDSTYAHTTRRALTVSIGLTLFPSAAGNGPAASDHVPSLEHLIETADRALYHSKKNGRNCCTLF